MNRKKKIIRVKVERGLVLYEQIDDPNLAPLGVIIKPRTYDEVVIDSTFIQHFHEKFKNWLAYNGKESPKV